ncbi:MAG: DUF308 domain-containing protein [Tannerellaceae bacterium]|jgi:uncharacterized membrane protein HdeD (DUF308 family)|nr:DUF308 domain-containing protein [Tannerellaceae bacterium]
MMVNIYYSVWRSVVAVMVGLLFIMWPEESVTYLVVTTGVFFILGSVGSVFAWWLQRGKAAAASPAPVFWVAAAGSLFLGIWLVVSPAFFVALFGRLWGAVLVLAGLQQVFSLLTARRHYAVGVGYYFLPALIFIAGVVILVYPVSTIANTFILLGTISLFYGVNELIGRHKFGSKRVESSADSDKGDPL